MESNTRNSTSEGILAPQGVIFTVSSLYAYLLRMHNRRKRRRIRYSLVTILVMMILAKLCRLDNPYAIADWAQNRNEFLVEVLRLKRTRLPHHGTYRRILESVLDQDEFERMTSDFIQQCSEVGQEVVIAIDGKTLWGTITLDDPFGLHLLAAYLPREGIVLFQRVVKQEKENEIVMAPQLLKTLDLRQKVVVADAMYAQRSLSLQIILAGGDFVWTIKDNQLTNRQAIELLFTPQKPLAGEGRPPMDSQQAHTIDKAHGRLEGRTITVSSMLNDYLD